MATDLLFPTTWDIMVLCRVGGIIQEEVKGGGSSLPTKFETIVGQKLVGVFGQSKMSEWRNLVLSKAQERENNPGERKNEPAGLGARMGMKFPCRD